MRLMDLYDCGCYDKGKCSLTRKEALDCIYYDKCMSGAKPPKLVMDGDDGYITDNI
jgi:hypothetical protein